MNIINDVTNDVTKPGVRRRGEVTGVERRRRWSPEQKGRIVAEAIAPEAVVSEVARRHDLHPQQLWNWIRAAKGGGFAIPVAETGFVPVVADQPAPGKGAADKRCAAIEVAIGSIRVLVGKGADAYTLAVVLRTVREVWP